MMAPGGGIMLTRRLRRPEVSPAGAPPLSDGDAMTADALLATLLDAADLLMVPGAPPHLLLPVSPQLLDALAEWGAEAAEAEPEAAEEDDPAEAWRAAA